MRLFVPFLLATLALPLQAQTPDHEAVRRAAMDYLEGFYTGDSTLHMRSVRPEVYKYGFARNRETGAYAGMQMTWPQFHAFTNRVRTNNRPAPANAPKEVIVYEVLDQTASAKVVAWWGDRLPAAGEVRREVDDLARAVAVAASRRQAVAATASRSP